MSAQISVDNTNIISKEARRLFFNPNCIGVNMKLNTRLRIKGKVMVQG